MYPILFHSDFITIYTHDFFSTVGLLIGLLVYYIELHRNEMLSGKIFWISIAAVLGGTFGARVITAWEHLDYYKNFGTIPFTYFISHSGKSIIGTIAGGYLAIYLSKRTFNYTLSTGDCYAPAIPLAMTIGRIGCFLSEMPLGTPTTLPWGISTTPEIAAQFTNCLHCTEPMHPTMIYEIIFHLLALFVILRWRHLVPVRGETLKLYLITSALFRFFVEFIRGNTVQLWGLTGPQIVLIPLTALLVWHFFRQWKRGIYRIPTPQPAHLIQQP
jgi:phosphatidylglycerol---prolipoprotein diacylglyceryl transferase